MKLSPKQIKWVNKIREELVIKCKVYDSFPENQPLPKGSVGDRLYLMQLQLIIDLHNLEVNKNDKRDSVSSENVSAGILSFGS